MASTVNGFTIWSVDNSWYLPQIKNVLSGEGYTSDPRNPEFKVRRTPGYPAFYGLHYILFGESNGFFIIRYTQIFMHLLAALLLGQAVFNFTSNRLWAVLSAFFYGLNPFTAIYLYATITESISPALMVFILFAYSLCLKSPRLKNYFILGIMVGIGLLVRPLLIVVFPSIALTIVIEQSIRQETLRPIISKIFRNLTFVALGTSIIIAPWAIRNYLVTGGELILLERYYDDNPMDFGRGHSSFRDWISCWDNPANTSAEIYGDLVRANLRENKPIEVITEDFLNKIPPRIYSINSRESVAQALDALNQCFKEKQETLKNNPHLTRREVSEILICEDQVVRRFGDLTAEFKTRGLLRYYILTPLIFLKSIIFQSNSHMVGMLGAPAGLAYNAWQTGVKSLMYLLNVMLYISLILFVLTIKKSFLEIKVFIVSFVLITVWLCVFYFRYAEARYFITCVPPLCVALAYVLSRVFAVNKASSVHTARSEEN